MPKTDESGNQAGAAFLTLDSRVPAVIRDLLAEADGCAKNGYLTGGTACTQRAIQALFTYEQITGADMAARVRALTEKHPVPQLLSTVLLQFGDSAVRDGAKLNANGLTLLTVTLKAIAYEIYVLGPERVERLQHVRQILDSIERKSPDKRAAPASAGTSPARVEKAS